MKLQKEVTSTIYIIKRDDGEIITSTTEMLDFGWITIDKQEVTLKVPQDFDEQKAIEEMKIAKRKKLDEEYQRALADV